MGSQIFISYSKKDKDFAWKLADDLVNAGHKVWIDRSLQVGEDWEQTIESKLAAADEVIVILSPNAVASKWVQHEGSIAYGLKKRMYPVLIAAVLPQDLPLWASKFQYHSFVDVDYEGAFRALHAVLTPPNPIQDLLDQQVYVYRQTGELIGEALLRVIQDARDSLSISHEARQVIEKSVRKIEERQQREQQLLQEKEAAEKQRLQDQILAADRLRRRNRYLTAAGIIAGIAAMAAFVLAYMANRSGIEANREAQLALSRELAATSLNQLKVDPELSALLALEALNISHNFETEDALRQATVKLHLINRIDSPETYYSRGVISPNGEFAVIETEGNEIQVWNTLKNTKEFSIIDPDYVALYRAAFSNDGSYLAISTRIDVTRIISTATGEELMRIDGQYQDYTFSPKGDLFAATIEGTTKVWDVGSRLELIFLEMGGSAISFDPGGERIAFGFYDEGHEGVMVWDIEANQKTSELFANDQGSVYETVFSPDGKFALTRTAYPDTTVRVYAVATGELITVFDKHKGGYSKKPQGMAGIKILAKPLFGGPEGGIYDAQFNSSGNIIASAGEDGRVRIWDAFTGKEYNTLTVHEGEVYGLSFIPGSDLLITGGDDRTVRVININTGKELVDFAGHSGSVEKAVLNRENNVVVSITSNGDVYVWELKNDYEASIYQGYGPLQTSVFNQGGNLIAMGGWFQEENNGWATIIDVEPGRELRSQFEHNYAIYTLGFIGDSDDVLSTDAGSYGPCKAVIWNARESNPLFELPNIGMYDCIAATNSDGSKLITGRAEIWDVRTGQLLTSLIGHTDVVTSVALNSTGDKALTASWDGTVRLWDTQTGALIAVLEQGGQVYQVQFNYDESKVVAVGNRNFVVWDLSNRSKLLEIDISKPGLRSFVASPDFHWAVTFGLDQTKHLIDITAGEVAMELGEGGNAGFNNTVSNGFAAFSPDSRFLATINSDRTVTIWDLSSMRQISVLRGHQNIVNSVTFSHDGRWVLTSCKDGYARIYAVNIEDLQNIAEGRITRTLTCEERNRYLHEDQACRDNLEAGPSLAETQAP